MVGRSISYAGLLIRKGDAPFWLFIQLLRGGKLSRIIDHLDEGACVCTSRTDVHIIVTEYGIANLRGKSVPERAKSLIGIAHPEFKDELWHKYRKLYS